MIFPWWANKIFCELPWVAKRVRLCSTNLLLARASDTMNEKFDECTKQKPTPTPLLVIFCPRLSFRVFTFSQFDLLASDELMIGTARSPKICGTRNSKKATSFVAH